MSPAPDERIDRLYALPLDEFTAERNALAAELRGEGDHESAARVKALRKPSRVAWAVNQIVRAEPDLVDSLMGAGGELRQAHRQAASGRGAAQLRNAYDAERAAIERLVERLPDVLGTAPSAPLVEAVRNSLHAASGDDDARSLVASGRLAEELRSVGLGPLPGGSRRVDRGHADISRTQSGPPASGKHRHAHDSAGRAVAEALARERALQKEYDAAARAVNRAEDSLARAREAAEAASARAAEARKRLRAAKAGLRDAQKVRARLGRMQDR